MGCTVSVVPSLMHVLPHPAGCFLGDPVCAAGDPVALTIHYENGGSSRIGESAS